LAAAPEPFRLVVQEELPIYIGRQILSFREGQTPNRLAVLFLSPVPASGHWNQQLSAYLAEHNDGDRVFRGDFDQWLFPNLSVKLFAIPGF
jgi:hypothetical protein